MIGLAYIREWLHEQCERGGVTKSSLLQKLNGFWPVPGVEYKNIYQVFETLVYKQQDRGERAN